MSDVKIPDHPEKYMSWSSLERKFLQPIFNENAELKRKLQEAKLEIKKLSGKGE